MTTAVSQDADPELSRLKIGTAAAKNRDGARIHCEAPLLPLAHRPLAHRLVLAVHLIAFAHACTAERGALARGPVVRGLSAWAGGVRC